MKMSALILALFVGSLAFVSARPSITECRLTDSGSDYQGKVDVTAQGIPCQRWDSQSPHPHNYSRVEFFPDSSLDDLANYCRNPDENIMGIYCYTTDPNVPQQPCNIPKCSDYPECRSTDKGTEYLGFTSSSSSGSECLDWVGTDYPDEESNYCRNPDDRSTGPWCYVAEDQAESCDVPFCKPSAACKRTKLGKEYVGTFSLTINGRVCQRWDNNFPHSHSFTGENFPDGTLTDAQNFCRNPDDKADGPWCYTTDSDTEWEYCQLPTCQDCISVGNGKQYFGDKSTTESGHTCQRWDSQSPHTHGFTDPNRFPDASVESASNFCRNPDGKPDGPWCYTTDSSTEWEYCGVSSCTERSQTLTPIANHVVHIGIDGLRPDCIGMAPGGAPNILQRLGEKGTYTLTNARAVLLTRSGPSWGTTLCGMSIERTGILANDWFPPWRGFPQDISPATGNSSPLPCVYQTLKAQDASIRTAAMYDWWWFIWMANKGYPGYVDKEVNCPAQIYGYKGCDVQITNEAVKYLENMYKTAERSYSFIYLGDIDFVGHRKGWCGPEFKNATDVADAQVGQILDVIEAAGKEDDTVVILSADHGGEDFDHGTMRDIDLLVPMFIKGPGIKANHKFETVVEVADIVPTAARVLGLKPNPWWNGRVMSEAFVSDLELDPTTCNTEVSSVAGQIDIQRFLVILTPFIWMLSSQ